MPHPERCVEDVLGNDAGRLIFMSMLDVLKKAKFQPKVISG
jgi:phosphoribosylformylglycinamidine (FGAM) synthase-like amidotransferase family enzyme